MLIAHGKVWTAHHRVLHAKTLRQLCDRVHASSEYRGHYCPEERRVAGECEPRCIRTVAERVRRARQRHVWAHLERCGLLYRQTGLLDRWRTEHFGHSRHGPHVHVRRSRMRERRPVGHDRPRCRCCSCTVGCKRLRDGACAKESKRWGSAVGGWTKPWCACRLINIAICLRVRGRRSGQRRVGGGGLVGGWSSHRASGRVAMLSGLRCTWHGRHLSGLPD